VSGLKTLLEKEECDRGELDVDNSKFFKKMSDLDEKIFDEYSSSTNKNLFINRRLEAI
jgi:hypothetical protein